MIYIVIAFVTGYNDLNMVNLAEQNNPEMHKLSPPYVYIDQIAQMLVRDPDSSLDALTKNLPLLADSLLPHLRSLAEPVNFNQFIPQSAQDTVYSPENHPWHASTTLMWSDQSSAELRMQRTDAWNGSGVTFIFVFKTSEREIDLAAIQIGNPEVTLRDLKTMEEIRIRKSLGGCFLFNKSSGWELYNPDPSSQAVRYYTGP